MVVCLNMLLCLKYTTVVLVIDNNVMQHSAPTEIQYTHSVVKYAHPTWSPYLTQHTGTALCPRTALTERSRLTGESVGCVVGVSCSVDIAEHAADPDCARGNSSLLDKPLSEEIPVLQLSRFYLCPSGGENFETVRGLDVWNFCLTLCLQNVWLISMKKLATFG